MKKLKVVILSALVMTGLAGCGDEGGNEPVTPVDPEPVTPVDPEPQHTHTFSNEWSSDATQHWHAATCEHTDLKANVANHVDSNHDGKCDECLREGLAVQHTEDPNKPGFCICGEKISVVAVELDTSKAKLVYAPGEELDTTGVKLTATYLDGSKKEIDFTPSTVDLSTTGKKTVTLTYSKEDLDGTTGTISYDISVVYWSEKEIEVIQDQTFLGLGELVLPYLPGMELDYVEGAEGIESWSAFKQNATLDDFNEYYQAFKEFGTFERDVKFGDQTIELTFRFVDTEIFTEMEENYIESEYGFAAGAFFVFRLAPLYESRNGLARAFAEDEYFIAGINGDGELRLYDRFVSSYTDFLLAEEDQAGFAPYDVSLMAQKGYTVADFLSDFPSFIGAYFSEVAEDYIPLANSSSTSGLLILESEQSTYPFITAYDDYDMVAAVDIVNGLESDYEAFVGKLVETGYQQDAVNENLYVLENQYIGHIEFELFPYSEHYVSEVYTPEYAELLEFDAGYGYVMYYAAPERGYVSAYTPTADQFISLFGELASDVEFMADSDIYYEYETEFVFFTVKKVDADLVPTDVLEELLSKIPAEAGFFFDGEREYDEEHKCYIACLTNGSIGFELDVYEPNEAGDVKVTLAVYEGYEILEIYVNKVALFAQINGFEIDVAPQGDGYVVATAVPKAKAAEDQEITDLQGAAEYIVGAFVQYKLIAEVDLTKDVSIGADGSLIVTAKSSDGDYDVVFKFFEATIKDVECFVCQIYIKNAIWSGTAEELIHTIAAKFGGEEYIEETDVGFAITDVCFEEYAYPDEYEEDLVNSNIALLESILPGGMKNVQALAKDASTGIWSAVYTTADGTVTLKIEITWTEVMEDGYVPFVSLYTYPTVA